MRFASSPGKSPTSRKVSTCRSGMTSRWTGAFGLMSSTATNPSAACTWSPSAASLQKRQSGRDAMDPFRGDATRAGADERADLSVHEPRRVVVAVPAAGSVDEDDVLAPDLCQPTLSAGLRRESPQPRRALLLQLGGEPEPPPGHR